MAAERKIIHIDCDCFYAAVEMRDNPSLRDVPLAIGGAAERRGVIATCNYPARRFGVRSAMSTRTALQRCPGLVLMPADFLRYRDASRAIHAIFRDYTERIEPLSLDEAYLDVTGLPHCRGSATLMAREIRARIASEVGITASAGIAPNKLLAKIASDWHKPDGQFVITPGEIEAFMPSLPVGKLWGVGKATAARLARMGVETCADLQGWPLARLVRDFGKMGVSLHQQCRGIDARSVVSARTRKSLSVEQTYAHDLADLDACLAALPELVDDFAARLSRSDVAAERAKPVVKIKFHDFSQTTVEGPGAPTLATFAALLQQGWLRGAKPVRLLGVGVRLGDAPPASGQPDLWG
ncbi:DNA polymerase IV [Jeongeupia naejangsanensis]|uniref:DNA polymerase IV n=1 Tax=Jeongeupia naejangsanensis TaxID=613195 RepID=A0ABS2BP20_9NEIS|nr:DNA polymerase IV [Jeongeupia naejangsanensis]MBM3117375.1 DNA polymerase IV [Jeongeupia naejangsanensis]